MSKPAHSKISSKGALPVAILAALAAFCVLGVVWTFSQWEELSVGEVLFTLRALEGTGNGMIESFALTVVLPAVVFGAVAYALLRMWRGKRGFPASRNIAAVLAIVAMVGSLAYLWQGMQVTEYLTHMESDEDFIADNYVDPAKTNLTFPEKKRNLIYIYLESMEVTYADKSHGGAFDESYIPELTEIALEGESFSGSEGVLNGAYSMPDTTWTTGAMVAHTSGLPLKIPIDGNGMNSQEAFFPQISVLGDILDDAGYRQILLIGSDASFGARKLWFEQHRNYEMHDYLYAKEIGLIPQDYAEFWGYEDEKLFGFAQQELLSLAQQGTPFNLTLLTVDTHFPDGYTCHLCRDEFDSKYGNVLACSSRQVSEFIDWCKQQDFYENTTIVVVGDHPTMDTDFVDLIDKDYDRRVFTAFLNMPEGVQATGEERLYTTFDLFPTTLASLGVDIRGGKLGLGTNLFSDVPTLTEEIGLDEEQDQLQYPSEFMNEVAAISEDTLVLKEQFARSKATVSCSVAQGSKFVLEAQIDPADCERMSTLRVFLSPKEKSKNRELIFEDQGGGRYTLEVDMDEYGVYGIYTYQLKAKTEAGLMDYGKPGEVDPATGSVSETKSGDFLFGA